MATSITELYVNGVALPTPALQGVTITHNKVWSSNTGRTASGNLVGTIVAIKRKLSIRWPPLTEQQVSLIQDAVNDPDHPFSTVRYRDADGQEVTCTMYFGDPSYTQYSWSDGIRRVLDVTVDAIEQ